MPFIEMEGVDGLVYVPETESPVARKHPCVDCEVCQHCSDTRCRICLQDPCRKRCRRPKRPD